MSKIEHVITNPDGMHARPAGILAGLCVKYKSDIKIIKGEKSVNAKSLLDIMGLCIKNEDKIIIEISGDDELKAKIEIQKLLNENGDKF
ncbi:MAG: HPr family phosphocarrier protein [Candidatus Paraimprobicoccus trichonymphae]|uniref:HPr family phosphocarrier protein n=1 Tax=Candidatus Paraimprobicoccus trichonymphae TaxID=3033793 RepID=A0AA48L174_9FIRM|nr:MAG: HPr family phosphocarrier protein [Candidatus Paraimprobicoccus trichonymphae]